MNSVHLCAGYFDVTAVKFGIEITVSNSAHGTYNIMVTASDGNTRTEQLSHNGNESVVPITNLKPCTVYTPIVTFTGNGTRTKCDNKGNKTIRTEKMGECKDKHHSPQT